MSDHAVVREVLKDLKGQAEKASRKFPLLSSMLVLPPGECLLLPENGTDQPPEAVCPRGGPVAEVAGIEYTGPLPPKSAWPEGLQQVATLSIGKPDRLHFLFGAGDDEVLLHSHSWRSLSQSDGLHLWRRTADGLQEFAKIAAKLMKERCGIDSAIFQDQRSPHFSVFHDSSGAHIRGARAVEHRQELDAWLCTMHWWAWKCPESPLRTRPRVVMGEKTIEADPLNHAVRERLSFSLLPCDVFSATASMIDLLTEFLDVPPDLDWKASYPPAEASPGSVQAAGKEKAAQEPASDQTAPGGEQGNKQKQSGDGLEWSGLVGQKDLRTKLGVSQDTLKARLVDDVTPVHGKYRCKRPKPTARKIQVAVEDMPEHLHGWLRKQVISG